MKGSWSHGEEMAVDHASAAAKLKLFFYSSPFSSSLLLSRMLTQSLFNTSLFLNDQRLDSVNTLVCTVCWL